MLRLGPLCRFLRHLTVPTVSSVRAPTYRTLVSGSNIKVGQGIIVADFQSPTKETLAFPVFDTIPFKNVTNCYFLPKDSPLAVQLLNAQPQQVAVFLTKQESKTDDDSEGVWPLDDLIEVGMLANVEEIETLDSTVTLKLRGLGRIKAITAAANPFYMRWEEYKDNHIQDKQEEEILKYALIRAAGELRAVDLQKQSMVDEIIQNKFSFSLSDLVDMLFGIFAGDLPPEQVSSVISENDVSQRTKNALKCLYQFCKFTELVKRMEKIEEKKSSGVTSNELKRLRDEMLSFLNFDNADNEEDLVEVYQTRLAKYPDIPSATMKVIKGELNKLRDLEKSSGDYHVCRNYLDLITSLPWGIYSEDNTDLRKAQEILDEDHFGMEDIKKRILEFIAVASLTGSVQGKILCFAGPPGVGKTSIAKSIARALNRKYRRIAVGGVDDPSEIKGHRRTYVGSMPGRIIQALKYCETSNPVILIDEIDKLGKSSLRGDPASCLLEVLDPSQNQNFLDHYVDTPYDISKVLFLATANYLDRIPHALYDRLEIIELAGYVTNEKMSIAKAHLIPKSRSDCGLSDEYIEITDEALRNLIEFYCSEPGVRNLERYIDKIFRRVAYDVSTCHDVWNKAVITPENLVSYVGNPIARLELLYKQSKLPGCVVGLYASGMGGGCLPVEAIIEEESTKGNLSITGNLGTVISESSSIAWSFSKKFLLEKGFESTRQFFEKANVHMHFPDGAVPKDGPSAGITMVTSLISLATNIPARNDVAMTGEITLNGKVLPIGGVQAKCLGAIRNGIKTVILPKANEKDWSEVPDQIKEDIEVIFVRDYSEVFKVMFGDEVDVKKTADTGA